MAATRLIALHVNKGKTVAQCLADRTDYSQNAEKTNDGEFISSYECDLPTKNFFSPKGSISTLRADSRKIMSLLIRYGNHLSLGRLHRRKQIGLVTKPQCVGRRETMRSSLPLILIKYTSIIILFIIPLPLIVPKNSEISFVQDLLYKN